MMSNFQRFLLILKSQNALKALFKYHVAASVENSSMLRQLIPDSIKTIIDIGANRGQFSLAARMYFPDSQIFAFEPLEEAAEVFRKVFKNDTHINFHETAIGPGEIDMLMHISRADDSSSLLPITSRQNELFPGTAEKGTRIVKVSPLGRFIDAEDIRQPALLKLDVQGFEAQVLEGCRSLLPSFDYIYAECSFVELYSGQTLADGVIDYLRDAGFVFCGVYNLTNDRNGIPIQGDFLFRRKEICRDR